MGYTLGDPWTELNTEGTYLRWLEERRLKWRSNVVVRKMVPKYQV